MDRIKYYANHIGYGDLNRDAWGRAKTINDYSIVHGLFTFDIPDKMWVMFENGTELTSTTLSTRSGSVNGGLSLKSGATLDDVSYIMSKRHPRYQPNRGYLYSSSIFLPNKTATGERDFGSFTDEDGAFFRLKSDGELYACILNNGVLTHEEKITVPFDIDYEKGNAYDIQFQWRGVGSYAFFVLNPVENVSQEVHVIKFANTLSYPSISNPALSIGFRATNKGDEVEIRCGCVDVSSEGGAAERLQYVAATGEIVTGVQSTGAVLLAVRLPNLFKGRMNTRDVKFLRVFCESVKRADMSVYITRDETALTINNPAVVWTQINGGNIEALFPTLGTDVTIDDAKAAQIAKRPVLANDFIEITNPDILSLNFFLTHGDYLIVEGYTNAGDMSAGLELGEEI